MDIRSNMIIIKGKDMTTDIRSCNYNKETKKYDITFINGGQLYSYHNTSVKWLLNPVKVLSEEVSISHNGKILFNVEEIFCFRSQQDIYWRIIYQGGRVSNYKESSLTIVYSCLLNTKSNNCFNYLKEISKITELKSDLGEVLLEKQYDKMKFVGSNTALAIYLNPQQEMKTYPQPLTIFPFGGNASQFQAVKQALTTQMSVIQGPPGTGKTQTILNIIANLLLQGKNVQIVSNNNIATLNVKEKLEQSNLDFLVAALGNGKNKESFIEDQSECYPDMETWKSIENKQDLQYRIANYSNELFNIFTKQERLAVAKQELLSLQTEKVYFDEYQEAVDIINEKSFLKKELDSNRLMELWQAFGGFIEREKPASLWFKIKSIFDYGMMDWEIYKQDFSQIITMLQNLFFEAKEKELKQEIELLENELMLVDDKEMMKQLTILSMRYLKGVLFEKYKDKVKRVKFKKDDLWMKPQDIIEEYPIILSSTFSSRSSLGKGVIYDYVIMDEASQVSVETGALALSCAKNAVIVGDIKQLPNIVSTDMKRKIAVVEERFHIRDGYKVGENSFLESVLSVMPQIKDTLLREHYRCHPKIIGFCNQKFYNNQLIIMTEDKGELDVISLYKTVKGNHDRNHLNQRQIDIVVEEVLPNITEKTDSIGIIAPYNKQVTAISEQIKVPKIEMATVHKFQGREKDAIIVTTVDDIMTEFTDNPSLLNVAVSRAKKQLILVVSSEEHPINSNIGDLISYIEYNNFEIVESKIYSVFDYLYQQYSAKRLECLKTHKRVSKYDSENLVYLMIRELIKKNNYSELDVIVHKPLRMIIKNIELLSREESQYAMNAKTHIDFLIYSKISKKPILVIEVDGYKYHNNKLEQEKRDKMKDHILSLYHIPILRLPTNGSGENQKIVNKLHEIINQK